LALESFMNYHTSTVYIAHIGFKMALKGINYHVKYGIK